MQGDLFEFNSISSASSQDSKESFLVRYRISLRFDQIVVIFILAIIVFAVVFSFGVEKGKREGALTLQKERQSHQQNVKNLLMKFESQKRADLIRSGELDQPKVQPALEDKADNLPSPPVIVVQEADKPQVAALVNNSGKFTIQIVTYETVAAAERQISDLKKKGLNGFIIPSGNFKQVCVNSFDSRKDASDYLMQLKMQKLAPKDAYVRVIP